LIHVLAWQKVSSACRIAVTCFKFIRLLYAVI
jgi:hypothetical protein